MTDNLPDTSQNRDNFSKFSILELSERYGIGRDPVYARMNYLQIKTYKESGKAYLTAEQVQHMDGLHEHIKATSRMDGYPVPEKSWPWEEEKNTSNIVVQPQTQNLAPQQQDFTATGEREAANNDLDPIANIVKSAQSKAAGILIAENLIARQYIDNPEALPEELKQKIKESGQVKTVDPFAYAQSLVNFAQAGLAIG
ncbi:MAG: hypothetical protein KME21_31550 [Desmonostoc vinosum HA7617-LM4]|jgi:hypothetical protein|nr:hypothetical protein [Desmonostoc vinosum HA7617-LM4]